jgi:cold shock CspA family protein
MSNHNLLLSLVSMGFKEEDAHKALTQTNYNLQIAINQLINKNLIIIEYHGIINNLVPLKGYGFIEHIVPPSPDNNSNMFFHYTKYDNGLTKPSLSQYVIFNIEMNKAKNKLWAVNVRIDDNHPNNNPLTHYNKHYGRVVSINKSLGYGWLYNNSDTEGNNHSIDNYKIFLIKDNPTAGEDDFITYELQQRDILGCIAINLTQPLSSSIFPCKYPLNTARTQQTHLIYNGELADEDRSVEYKSLLSSANPINLLCLNIEKYANGFLNSNGGWLYFGVENGGRIVGFVFDRAQRDIIRRAVDNLMNSSKPPVDSQLYELHFLPLSQLLKLPNNERFVYKLPERYVIALEVRAPVENSFIYYTSQQYEKSQAYVRRDGSLHIMSPAIINQRNKAKAAEEEKKDESYDHCIEQLLQMGIDKNLILQAMTLCKQHGKSISSENILHHIIALNKLK